ncbi:FecCD family ABC transporter permease [Aneurinibacillus terranovensis]|uniref:FecCD family ABC transporter permease n=1 Tax=Aneurinibacillus terranovensis TaxID=278991 RepID=UPI0006841BBF|nr:iron chelate uptake ABC transporter family permease subunit [Aneurinibacillus terranovensis]
MAGTKVQRKPSSWSWYKRLVFWLLLLSFLLFLAVMFSVSLGSANLSYFTVWQIIMSHLPFGLSAAKGVPSAAETIVWEIRMPRVLLAVLVGAALASSGVVYQGVLRNPLADPYILGVSSGASLGAALVIMFGWQISVTGQWTLPLVSFICGLATLFIVYRLAFTRGRVRIESLILSGVVVQAFLGAGLSLVLSQSQEKAQQIIFWLMGSLTLSDWTFGEVIFPYIAGGILVMYGFARELNIMALGEEHAHHLGMNVGWVRLVLLIAASLTAGAAVSVSGVIGFVGLIVPHIMRMLVGSDHRLLFPVSAIAGSVLLVIADTLARIIMQPQELPIGVITAFLGAPFFAYLLRQTRKNFF